MRNYRSIEEAPSSTLTVTVRLAANDNAEARQDNLTQLTLEKRVKLCALSLLLLTIAAATGYGGYCAEKAQHDDWMALTPEQRHEQNQDIERGSGGGDGYTVALAFASIFAVLSCCGAWYAAETAWSGVARWRRRAVENSALPEEKSNDDQYVSLDASASSSARADRAEHVITVDDAASLNTRFTR